MKEPTTEKQRYWADLLKAAEDSGMSLVEFARSKDIPVQRLYQWRSTLWSTVSGQIAALYKAREPECRVTASIKEDNHHEYNPAKTSY